MAIFSLSPIPQDVAFHQFADSRRFLGIPNALDVLSNLPFLLISILGIRQVLDSDRGPTFFAWLVLFVGIGLVSFGSAYYHWSPDNNTLVWDRLPITVGFMGLFGALLVEHVSVRLKPLQIPLIIVGIGSVLYWYVFDDLRFYVWVQFVPLLLIPFLLLLFKSRYSHQYLLLISLVLYGFAKLFEWYDIAVFQATAGVISGHTFKHVLAALSCYCLLFMLQKRSLVESPQQAISHAQS